jgi:hypothetical protein
MLYNIRPETLNFRDTRQRQMGRHISLQFHLSRVIMCTQDTQCTAGVSCNRLFME